jgi:hypothetical protein
MVSLQRCRFFGGRTVVVTAREDLAMAQHTRRLLAEH